VPHIGNCNHQHHVLAEATATTECDNLLMTSQQTKIGAKHDWQMQQSSRRRRFTEHVALRVLPKLGQDIFIHETGIAITELRLRCELH
jgi:hypothetical protein